MRLLLATAVVLLLPAPVRPQTPATRTATAPTQNLAEFEGQYQYRDGLTLSMVTSGKQLVAVINDAKYLLRVAGTDLFLNPAGDSIPFIRDANGRIVAFKENNVEFARLSLNVPPAARLLLRPRANGPDGSPVVYRYQPPPRLNDGIAVGKAGPATLPTKVAELLVNRIIDGTYANVHSILIYHKGALVLEEYFYGFDRNRTHEMRSLTKSAISLIAGAAVDRGLLRADEPVIGGMGYSSLLNPDARKAKITLTHLLTNQSGLACNEYDRSSPGHEMNLFETPDWVKAFVDLPVVAEPGTVGSYCSGGFYATGQMVERAAGKPLPEFADEVLFGPLGIQRTDWKWNFTLDRSQRNDFAQLHLRPRDMLKLGILIQNRGQWKDRRIVSSSWIDTAVGHQSRIDDSDYGLGIWHRWYGVQTPAGDRRVDTVMLSGNGGQKVYLVPSLDLIVVSTGNAFFVESPLNEVMARVLLPALIGSSRN